MPKEVPFEVVREVDYGSRGSYGSRDFERELEDRKEHRRREAAGRVPPGRANARDARPDKPLDYGRDGGGYGRGGVIPDRRGGGRYGR